MRRHFRLPSLAILLALAFLAAAASTVDARTKRFNPLDFVPANSSVNSVRNPVAVGGATVPAGFVAPLGLPVGATLTGIRFYSNGGGVPRDARVIRFAYPAAPEVIAGVSSNAHVPSLVTPALTNGAVHPNPAVRVVDPGYLYYVELNCAPGTAIWAVDVDYTP